MTSPIPFRTHPRTVGMENHAEPGKATPSEHLAVEQILRDIESATTLSPKTIELAVTHPDERIVLAIIERWSPTLWWCREDLWKIYLRGVQVSETEGIVWHPIFDALAIHQCWPQAPPANAEREDRHRPLEKQIELLIPWIEQQEDAEAIEPLLGFHAREVLTVVARYAGMLTEGLAKNLYMPSVAQNPRLSKELAQKIATQAVFQLTTDVHEWRTLRNSPDNLFRIADGGPVAEATLSHLIQQGHPIPRILIDRLVRGVRGPYSFECINLLIELGQQVDEAQLAQAIRNASTPFDTIKLLKHPTATGAFQKRMLATLPESIKRGVRQGVAQDPKMLAVPEIRQWVLNTNSQNVLWAAMRSAAHMDADVFRDVLDRCVARKAKRVASLVGEKSQPGGMGKEWVERIRAEFWDDLIDSVIKHDIKASKFLMSSLPALKNERLQEALIEYPDAPFNALYALLDHVRGERFRRLFRRLASFGTGAQRKLLTRLTKSPVPEFANLEPEDFAPMLQSSDRNVRLKTMLYLAERTTKSQNPQPAESPVGPDPTRQAPNRPSPGISAT